MNYKIASTSADQTLATGQRLAKCVNGGDVIELSSDLGGGKTTFVQGLASGLGYQGPVTSPTFTLSNLYIISADLELHHYDLYRLGDGGVLADELAEDIRDPHVITVIEWANVAKNKLPLDHLTIEFEVTSDAGRNLHFIASGPKSASIIKRIMT